MDVEKIRILFEQEIRKTKNRILDMKNWLSPFHQIMLLVEFREWMPLIIRVLQMLLCEKQKNVWWVLKEIGINSELRSFVFAQNTKMRYELNAFY